MSGEPGSDAVEQAPGIPDAALVAALEFAVGIAAAGVRQRPPLRVPAALRPFLKLQKLPPGALARVRAAIDADPRFRTALAAAARAAPQLLDEASLLWLTRPDGWEAAIGALAADLAPADPAAELRRSERRREAAEAATVRALAEAAALRAELDRRGDAAAATDAESQRVRRELAAAREEADRQRAAARRAFEQAASAEEHIAAVTAERDAALQRAVAAELARDTVLAARASGSRGETAAMTAPTAATVLAGAGAVADELAQRSRSLLRLADDLAGLTRRLHDLEPTSMAALLGPGGPAGTAPARPVPRAGERGRASQASSRRRPIAVPGGLYGDSVAAAEHLVRHPNAIVVVDGYNVAKLRFPTLTLEHQRERCIDLCEDLARRWGTDLVVVFDGTNGGASAGSARRLVRVTYSAVGEIADDVIRREVAALPAEVPVVVVTNDQAVITDVRALGANPVSSDRFLELATR